MSINDGLISLYNFNGNAMDSGGGGFHGVINGAIPTTDNLGNSNSAYLFDGVNDYISIGDVMDIGLSDFSYAVWFKTSSVGALTGVFGKSKAGVGAGRWSFLFESGLLYSLLSLSTTTRNVAISQTPYIDGNWHLFTATMSRTGNHTLYIDGVNKGSVSISADSAVDSQSTFPLGIGAYQNSAGTLFTQGFFNGSIGGIRVWNRALSNAEVISIYNSSKGNHSILSTGEYLTHAVSNLGVDSTGLALLLNMNGNARDGSGNHYHGTVTGATLTTDQLGNANSAYLFNGTSNYISLGDVLDVGLGDLSYSLWFNTSTVGGGFVGLLNKSRAAGANGRYGTTFTGGELYSFIDFDTAANIWKVSVPQTPFIDGNWHNLTVTMKRTGNLTMYIDGINKGVVDISAHVATDCSATDLLGIGAYQNSTGTAFTQGFFNGSIADVRMYSRELSALEVLQLYNTGLGKVSRIKGKTYTKGFNTNTPPTTPIKLSQKKGSLISSSLITL